MRKKNGNFGMQPCWLPKHILSVLLCCAVLLGMLPVIALPTNAASAYHAASALAYAQEHWNDGVGLCAEFVSRCINAGGCSAFSVSASMLLGQLRNSGMGTEYQLALNSDMSITAANYAGKLAAGDPVFYYCPGCTDGRPYVHTVLCNGMDGNGYMKAYSHNNANNGQQKYHYSRNCPYCGTKNAYAIAYHFEGGSTDPSTLAFQGINWPTAVACGDPYSIYGTVSSNYPIHYVGVYIYDLDGNEVQSKVVKPNAGSYDIHQIDNDIKFGSLPSGTYIFQVEATDDSDRFILSNCEFVIYNDLGDDLYGVLINTACWKPIAPNSDGNVELQTETGSQNQYWRLSRNGDGSYTITSAANGKVLDADASGGSDGTNVQVWEKHGGANQKWWFFSTPSGYVIRPAYSSRVLDLTSNCSEDGTNIQLWAQNHTDAQKWSFYTNLASFTVTYDANGGTGEPSAQVKKQGTDLTLRSDVPTRNGYVFISWNTKADGTGTSYAPGGTYIRNADVTLYAQWQEPCANGHAFGNWLQTKSPTCTEQGEETRTCTDCGKEETRAIEALGHDYKSIVTAPSCTDQGYTTHTCTRCGNSYIDAYVEALGHDWKLTETREPTETEGGYRLYTCERCNQTRRETIPALGPQPTDPEPQKNPFVDVEEGRFYYEPVLWAVEKGITSGVDATHFMPDANCTRGQVVTFLWRSQGCPEPTGTETPFVDVSSNRFYYKAVLWAFENGITAGMDATHFAPERDVTRGQFVTFLWRSVGKPAVSGFNPFVDVSSNHFYYTAVLWAAQRGITTGMDTTHFAPETNCSRGHVVTFLYRNEI